MARSYDTDTISITFASRRCIHARRCVLALPQVFREGRGRDWIAADQADPDTIMAVVRRCPSGALQYTRRDGGPAELAPPVNTVQLTEDGPLELRADLHLDGASIGFRATLCRCGHSRTKPFCDGSHTAAGFAATGLHAADALRDLPSRDGPVTITPQADGPLRVEGSVELRAASGTPFARTTRVSLCRCGQSQDKPFCDGSHTAAGFSAPGA